MKHYVYKLEDITTGEFYFGSRSCSGSISDDVYFGSSKNWNPNIENLKKIILKSNFRKRETCIRYESKLIRDNIDNPLNRNYHIPTDGFHTFGMKWNEESKLKLSKSCTGRIANNKGIRHTQKTIEQLKKRASGRYSLEWFINKHGEVIGTEKYKNKGTNHSKKISGSSNGMYGQSHSTESKQKMSINSSKKVGKFDLENNLLYIYNSINEASSDNNISISSISAVCNPKRINKTAGGFIWKFM